MQTHIPNATGVLWYDTFVIVAIIIPHVVTLLLALFTYMSSRDNHKKLTKVERTLNGKEDDEHKVTVPLDKLR